MAEQARAEKPIIEVPPRQYGSDGEQVFDNRTHIRDADSGRLLKKQPYAYHVFNDTKMWERPIGSGNMYNHFGDPIGRWKSAGRGAWEKISETHSDAPTYEKVMTVEDLVQRNSELELEVAALKAEQTAKTTPPQKTGKA